MRRQTLLALALVALAGGAQATTVDLLEAWGGVQGHDRELASARLNHAASQTKRDQASALWKPNVMLSGTAGAATSETAMNGAAFSMPGQPQVTGVNFATSVTGGKMTRWAVQAQQPLYNRGRSAGSAQLKLQADLGDSGWQAAQMDLMLRTAQRYFDVALAQERQRILARQLQAVQRSADEAHERFRLGDVAVTDSHEADAALAGLKAQKVAADLDLDNKRQILADSIGVTHPTAMLPTRVPALVSDKAMEQWLQSVQGSNAQLRMQQIAAEIARQEVRKHDALSSVTVDLVAQAGKDRVWGSGDFGQASNRNTNYMVGVQVNIPLYTGGMRSAKEREAVALADKAEADLQQAQTTVGQQARLLWSAREADAARVRALEEALKAAASRLDATYLGRAVGDRTTLNVLNAKTDHANTAQSLAEARVSAVMNQLRLAAMTSQLDEGELRRVNATLKPVTAP